MERVGIFFRLKPDRKEEYIKRHDQIWPEVTAAIKDAGIRNFSIWNEGDLLFSYYEVKDAARAEEFLSKSEIYQKWRDCMEEYVYIDSVTAQKEWPMRLVFLQE